MPDNQQDAQHPASAIRLQQATSKGDFPRSIELANSFQLMCGVASCYFLVGSFASQFAQFTNRTWSENSIYESARISLDSSVWQILLMVSPLLLTLLLISIFSHVIQNTKFAFFNKPIVDTANLNPLNNSRRIFSIESILRTALGIPKVTVILGVTFLSVWYSARTIVELPFQAVSDLLPQLADSIFKVLLATTATMFLLSGIDYVVELYGFNRRHRMTDEELREENRLQNVDPQIGARRQQLYQDLT